jgi:hypothetical protein
MQNVRDRVADQLDAYMVRIKDQVGKSPHLGHDEL